MSLGSSVGSGPIPPTTGRHHRQRPSRHKARAWPAGHAILPTERRRPLVGPRGALWACTSRLPPPEKIGLLRARRRAADKSRHQVNPAPSRPPNAAAGPRDMLSKPTNHWYLKRGWTGYLATGAAVETGIQPSLGAPRLSPQRSENLTGKTSSTGSPGSSGGGGGRGLGQSHGALPVLG